MRGEGGGDAQQGYHTARRSMADAVFAVTTCSWSR